MSFLRGRPRPPVFETEKDSSLYAQWDSRVRPPLSNALQIGKALNEKYGIGSLPSAQQKTLDLGKWLDDEYTKEFITFLSGKHPLNPFDHFMTLPDVREYVVSKIKPHMKEAVQKNMLLELKPANLEDCYAYFRLLKNADLKGQNIQADMERLQKGGPDKHRIFGPDMDAVGLYTTSVKVGDVQEQLKSNKTNLQSIIADKTEHLMREIFQTKQPGWMPQDLMENYIAKAKLNVVRRFGFDPSAQHSSEDRNQDSIYVRWLAELDNYFISSHHDDPEQHTVKDLLFNNMVKRYYVGMTMEDAQQVFVTEIANFEKQKEKEKNGAEAAELKVLQALAPNPDTQLKQEKLLDLMLKREEAEAQKRVEYAKGLREQNNRVMFEDPSLSASGILSDNSVPFSPSAELPSVQRSIAFSPLGEGENELFSTEVDFEEGIGDRRETFLEYKHILESPDEQGQNVEPKIEPVTPAPSRRESGVFHSAQTIPENDEDSNNKDDSMVSEKAPLVPAQQESLFAKAVRVLSPAPQRKNEERKQQISNLLDIEDPWKNEVHLVRYHYWDDYVKEYAKPQTLEKQWIKFSDEQVPISFESFKLLENMSKRRKGELVSQLKKKQYATFVANPEFMDKYIEYVHSRKASSVPIAPDTYFFNFFQRQQ